MKLKEKAKNTWEKIKEHKKEILAGTAICVGSTILYCIGERAKTHLESKKESKQVAIDHGPIPEYIHYDIPGDIFDEVSDIAGFEDDNWKDVCFNDVPIEDLGTFGERLCSTGYFEPGMDVSGFLQIGKYDCEVEDE